MYTRICTSTGEVTHFLCTSLSVQLIRRPSMSISRVPWSVNFLFGYSIKRAAISGWDRTIICRYCSHRPTSVLRIDKRRTRVTRGEVPSSWAPVVVRSLLCSLFRSWLQIKHSFHCRSWHSIPDQWIAWLSHWRGRTRRGERKRKRERERDHSNLLSSMISCRPFPKQIESLSVCHFFESLSKVNIWCERAPSGDLTPLPEHESFFLIDRQRKHSPRKYTKKPLVPRWLVGQRAFVAEMKSEARH